MAYDQRMAVPHDTDPKLADYAHPESLVTTGWLAEHLDDEGLVVVESDEDILLYETGHIPGSVKVDWHTELNDPITRDYVDAERFAQLMREKGISRDSTVVFYGDKSNWWAAYALWVFSLFGHSDLRLLDGGRAKWDAEGRPMTTEPADREPADYPVVERDDARIRAYRDDVLAHLGKPLVDVRSPDEYAGRSAAHGELSAGGRAARGAHPRRTQRPLGARRKRGRDVQVARRAGSALPAGDRAGSRRRGGRLLPHRRAVEPHLVRAEPPPGLRPRPQLRRLVDGVGQRGEDADRARGRPGVTSETLPPSLAEIVDGFAMLPPRERLEMLLEYSQSIPPLPERYAQHPERLEPVPECQSPLFVATELDDEQRVSIFVDAPPEAPTTRGFAGIFHAGLDGLPADEVLAVPGDVTARMALAEVVSPLRLRGASALLGRVQRQVREQLSRG